MGLFDKLLAKKCQRCNAKVVTRKEFDSELKRMGLKMGPGGSVTLSGGFSNYDDVYKLQSQVAEMEGRKAIQCSSCGKIYCVSCLFNYGPPHANGGKACFSCAGALKEL